jgi:hypothetical protein
MVIPICLHTLKMKVGAVVLRGSTAVVVAAKENEARHHEAGGEKR